MVVGMLIAVTPLSLRVTTATTIRQTIARIDERTPAILRIFKGTDLATACSKSCGISSWDSTLLFVGSF